MTVNKDEIRKSAEEARNMRGEYIDAQEYARDVLFLLSELDAKDAEIERLKTEVRKLDDLTGKQAALIGKKTLRILQSEESRKAAERERDLLKESLTAVVEENRIERTKRQEWVDSVEKEVRQYLKERDELRQQNAGMRKELGWYAGEEQYAVPHLGCSAQVMADRGQRARTILDRYKEESRDEQ